MDMLPCSVELVLAATQLLCTDAVQLCDRLTTHVDQLDYEVSEDNQKKGDPDETAFCRMRFVFDGAVEVHGIGTPNRFVLEDLGVLHRPTPDSQMVQVFSLSEQGKELPLARLERHRHGIMGIVDDRLVEDYRLLVGFHFSEQTGQCYAHERINIESVTKPMQPCFAGSNRGSLGDPLVELGMIHLLSSMGIDRLEEIHQVETHGRMCAIGRTLNGVDILIFVEMHDDDECKIEMHASGRWYNSRQCVVLKGAGPAYWVEDHIDEGRKDPQYFHPYTLMGGIFHSKTRTEAATPQWLGNNFRCNLHSILG